ncbi:hypothetical protein BJV78DRAFT_1236126 [Lactifluus subvellereus]|nr:hypothetical protein BJV78DRAFT_1236126 [Lactifluus subvellereus]
MRRFLWSPWFLTAYTVFQIPCLFSQTLVSLLPGPTSMRFHIFYRSRTYRKWLSGGIMMTAQETTYKLSAEIDDRRFESIPGFCSVTIVVDPQRSLAQSMTGHWAGFRRIL